MISLIHDTPTGLIYFSLQIYNHWTPLGSVLVAKPHDKRFTPRAKGIVLVVRCYFRGSDVTKYSCFKNSKNIPAALPFTQPSLVNSMVSRIWIAGSFTAMSI